MADKKRPEDMTDEEIDAAIEEEKLAKTTPQIDPFGRRVPTPSVSLSVLKELPKIGATAADVALMGLPSKVIPGARDYIESATPVGKAVGTLAGYAVPMAGALKAGSLAAGAARSIPAIGKINV